MNSQTYQTNNQKICDFYNQNPMCNFEESNLLLIDILKKANDITCNKSQLNNNFLNTDNIFSNTDNPILSNQNPDYSISYMEKILNEIYPSNEITQINNSKNFTISSKYNTLNILIENCTKLKNSNIEDVDEFILLCKKMNMHGIFLSHHAGIINKSNFEVELFDNLIVIFVHNTDYNKEKIKLAINIIENMYIKLKDFYDVDNKKISKNNLDNIFKECQIFKSQKELIKTLFKDTYKNILNQIDNINLNYLDTYLMSMNYNYNNKIGLQNCSLCNVYKSYSLKAIAAHKRGCIKKHNK